jgi:dTDP-4-amino-4,6-dideoxygalactose transaminase
VTFVATSNVVLQNRLRPVFVDVEPDHFGIDSEQLARHLSPRTRAVLPVHLFGQPSDMAGVLEFAQSNHLSVLEDSCETMFVRYRGKPSGSWGEVSCFSTYVAHLIVTGVGGFATTNDERLAVLMRSLINHGRDPIYLSIDDDDPDREILERIVTRRFSFDHVGYSYRATELEAALGLGHLAEYREMLRRRQENATYLTRQLEPLREFLQLPSNRAATEHAYMVYPIVVREDVPREQLLFHLEKAGIETRHLLPLLNQPVYRRLFGDLEPQYPVAAQLNRCGFFIGCHQGLSLADMEYVAEVFQGFFGTRRPAGQLASQGVSVFARDDPG